MITSDPSDITCTIFDNLCWNETEVTPGAFIGYWDFPGSIGGETAGLTDQTTTNSENIIVFPSPAVDHVEIKGAGSSCRLSIIYVNGALVADRMNVRPSERVEVSHLPAGVYLIRL